MCFDMIYHGQDEDCHCISGRNANAAMSSRFEGLVSIFQLKNPSYWDHSEQGSNTRKALDIWIQKVTLPKNPGTKHFQYFSAKSKQFTSNLLKQ